MAWCSGRAWGQLYLYPTVGLYLELMDVKPIEVCKIATNTFEKYQYLKMESVFPHLFDARRVDCTPALI